MESKKEIEKQIEESWESDYQKTDISKLPWEALKPPSRLVKLINSGEIKIGKAIDLGSGLGTNAIYLARMGFDVIALDVSKTALKIAEEKAIKENVKIKFIQGSAHKLNFPDKTFSLVFDRGCFHHIPEEFRKEYIENVHRVLEDGGKYYLECFCSKCKLDYGYRLSKEEIEKTFGEKFKIILIEELKNKGPAEGEVWLYSVFMEKKWFFDNLHIW